MAPPNPWMSRIAISISGKETIVMTSEAPVKMAIPYKKIRFLP